MRRLAFRSLCGLILIVALSGLAFLLLRWFEYALTFHPQPFSERARSWKIPEGGEDVWLTSRDGVRLHGWFISSDISPRIATVIFFHGNAGNLSNVGWLGEHLATRGFDVLLIDYRGYGRSEGTIRDEADLYSDADAAYEFVMGNRSVPPEKVALYGQSLGTVVAVDLASRRRVGALIIESGLSSASSMARNVIPWLPASLHWIGRYRFDSERKIALVNCPILITHGDPDDTIPTVESHKLLGAAKEPKRLMLVPGADHNVFGFGGERYLDGVAAFVQEALATPKPNSSN
jgi:uncharacterized protein